MLRNGSKQIFQFGDEEIVDKYLRLISAMDMLDVEEEFKKLFEGNMDCLYDDVALKTMEIMHKAYLVVLKTIK